MFSNNQNDINVNVIATPTAHQVGTSAVRLDASQLDAREGITLYANKRIYIGVNNSVGTSNAYYIKLEKGDFISMRLASSTEVWAISNTATAGSDDVLLGQWK